MKLELRLRAWRRKAARTWKALSKRAEGFMRAQAVGRQLFQGRPKGIASKLKRVARRTKRLAKHLSQTQRPKALSSLTRRLALIDLQLIGLRYSVQRHIESRGAVIVSAPILLAVVCSYLLAPLVQDQLAAYFNFDRFGALRSLLGTIGGALVGATAIGFSVVTVAVQLNFARMPHGLFIRLSSDPRLLGAFAGTFLLAVGVSTLSLIPDAEWVPFALITATWGTLLILILFLYGYRRALSLINPAVQLRLLVADAQNDLRRWSRRADRLAPLLITGAKGKDDDDRSTRDLPRAVFYRSNPSWTNRAKRDVAHAVSFVRRHADQGDFEVSAIALNSIVAINASYVAAKGKTFFASNPIFDVPDASDAFINDTLEHLRRLTRAATIRGDEEPTRQVFAAMALLVQVYLNIDYGRQDTKEHARLAAGYLNDAVEKSVSGGPPDLLMEGVRLVGQSGSLFLAAGNPNDATLLIEKLAAFSLTGAFKPEYQPVTLIGMEQLARLTSDLLKVQKRDIGFAAGQLRNAVEMVAKMFLNVPDTPLSNAHSSYLGPYFSITKTQSLADKLTSLTNVLVAKDKDDRVAKSILRNFDEWSDELYKTTRTLLQLALEKRSLFALDLLQWTQHITKLLVGLSKAPAADDHIRDELEKNAIWLISTISWIPDDAETISYVKTFSVAELIFESAIDAIGRDSFRFLECCRSLLMGWAFKAGAYETGWATFERSLLALVALALWKEELGLSGWLTAELAKRIEGTPIKQDIRDRAARNLRQQAVFPYRREYELDRIQHAMNQLEPSKAQSLLMEVANIISPGTANEKVRGRF